MKKINKIQTNRYCNSNFIGRARPRKIIIAFCTDAQINEFALKGKSRRGNFFIRPLKRRFQRDKVCSRLFFGQTCRHLAAVNKTAARPLLIFTREIPKNTLEL